MTDWAFVRRQMYAGMALIAVVLGIGLWNWLIWVLAAIVIFYFAWTLVQVKPWNAPDTPEQEAPTYGEIASQLQPLKDLGVTRASMQYVTDQVWWDDKTGWPDRNAR